MCICLTWRCLSTRWHGYGAFRRHTHTSSTFRCPPSRSQRAPQVPARTSTAWKFLVTFRLSFGALQEQGYISTWPRGLNISCSVTHIRACYWSTPSRLGYHAIGRRDCFLILVPAMDGVMSLQEVAVRSINQVSLREARSGSLRTVSRRTYGR